MCVSMSVLETAVGWPYRSRQEWAVRTGIIFRKILLNLTAFENRAGERLPNQAAWASTAPAKGIVVLAVPLGLEKRQTILNTELVKHKTGKALPCTVWFDHGNTDDLASTEASQTPPTNSIWLPLSLRRETSICMTIEFNSTTVHVLPTPSGRPAGSQLIDH